MIRSAKRVRPAVEKTAWAWSVSAGVSGGLKPPVAQLMRDCLDEPRRAGVDGPVIAQRERVNWVLPQPPLPVVNLRLSVPL
jgi:hypothetical protein